MLLKTRAIMKTNQYELGKDIIFIFEKTVPFIMFGETIVINFSIHCLKLITLTRKWCLGAIG